MTIKHYLNANLNNYRNQLRIDFLNKVLQFAFLHTGLLPAEDLAHLNADRNNTLDRWHGQQDYEDYAYPVETEQRITVLLVTQEFENFTYTATPVQYVKKVL